jgi:hypothetical protein
VRKTFLSALAAIPLIVTSCATPIPPQPFHNLDNNALIIKSIDNRTCQVLQPTASEPIENVKVMDKISALPHRQTAVVILENYTEVKIGDEFRHRSLSWFMGLRMLGYENIVFLQGAGGNSPEGLLTLVRYD